MRKNRMRDGIHHITIRENRYINSFINAIIRAKMLKLFPIAISFILIGYLMNLYEPFPSFYFFQVLFCFIFLGSIYAVKIYEGIMTEIHKHMSGDNTLLLIKDRNYRLRRSLINAIIPILISLYFGILAAILINEYLSKSTCIYLIIEYIIAVPVSLIGYLQYLYLLNFINSIKKAVMIKRYDSDYPAKTDWLVELSRLYGIYRNNFFIIGAMYVFGVIRFVFVEEYCILNKLSYSLMIRVTLILFWGGVFVAIVVLFPLSCLLAHQNIVRIVENLKKQAVNEIRKEFPKVNSSEQRANRTALIIQIQDTADYPLKESAGKIISCFFSAVDLAASVVAILQFFPAFR